MQQASKLRASDLSLRQEVRTWLKASAPHDWRNQLKAASEEEIDKFIIDWMTRVAAARYAVPTLPSEYGGAGLTFDDEVMIIEEMAMADTPPLDMFMVTRTHAPATILEWGTAAQKAKYLPGIGYGNLWCQGFSEPNAGSDLAALRTSAVRDEQGFIVNGQKIWSSFSKHAHYCLLLARTNPDAPKREGITYFLLDMTSPGIQVRPIKQATGGCEFSEIFLDNVRLPGDCVIGAVDGGWKVAQSTLAAERGLLAFERTERLWCHFRRFLSQQKLSNRAWLQDPQKLAQCASLLSSLTAERKLIRDFMSPALEDPKVDGTPLIIKISSTEIAQAVADFCLRVGEMDAHVYKNGLEQDFSSPMFDFIFTFGNTISAGTNEIMRNIISERVLGMPR